MRMNASTGFALCASITSLVFVGCSQLSGGGREPDSIQQLLEQAIANQVFEEGGTFMLGDVGRPNGGPYVTLTDFRINRDRFISGSDSCS